jgi:hypothetical protein
MDPGTEHTQHGKSEGNFRMTEKDAFDLWWEWAEKPLNSMLTIPAGLHDAVMALSPDERRDRAKVSEAAHQVERRGE